MDCRLLAGIWAHMGLRCANNKGADQPAHRPSFISASVNRLLESMISKLATSEFSS